MAKDAKRHGHHGTFPKPAGRARRPLVEPDRGELPLAGSASPEVAAEVRDVWIEEARRAGVDLAGFDPAVPLAARLAWAAAAGLTPAAVLSRYSSKMQHSNSEQVRECVTFAAANGFYVPPEFVCVDEGVSGRRVRRDGLDRMRQILRGGRAGALLVYKLSRLLRAAYLGFQLFQEELVDQGLRGVSVSQGIDTVDAKTWKLLALLHGISDEMLLDAISDHVRASLFGLARQGYSVGAMTVGYRGKPVPGGRPTNRGGPRTVPEVDPDAAAHIRKAFERVRDGLSLALARKLYNAEGGPADARSTTGRMSPGAFRRMLANPRYTGVWAFGRYRSVWSARRDYARRVLRAEAEVVVTRNEELRVVDDGLFFAVQERLAGLKRTAPTGPKRRKEPKLWDCVVACFHCGECKERFYVTGSNGIGMRCKNGPDCPSRLSLTRETAVRAVCDELARLVSRDAGLVAGVVAAAGRLDEEGEETARGELANVRRRIALLAAMIDELEELAGQGGEEGRRSRMAKILAAEQDRAALRAEAARLEAALGTGASAVTPERVVEVLGEAATLLAEGAAGRLAEEEVMIAAEAFRRLVGGRVEVRLERLPGRKRHPVRGVFIPGLMRAAREELRLPAADGAADSVPIGEVAVWLREPWPHDRLADRVGALVEREGLTYAGVVSRLAADGVTVSEMTVGRVYHRFRELRDLRSAAEAESPEVGPGHGDQDGGV